MVILQTNTTNKIRTHYLQRKSTHRYTHKSQNKLENRKT